MPLYVGSNPTYCTKQYPPVTGVTGFDSQRGPLLSATEATGRPPGFKLQGFPARIRGRVPHRKIMKNIIWLAILLPMLGCANMSSTEKTIATVIIGIGVASLVASANGGHLTKVEDKPCGIQVFPNNSGVYTPPC